MRQWWTCVSLLALLGALIGALAGCQSSSKRPGKPESEASKPGPPKPEIGVSTTEGEATRTDNKQQKLWKVFWKSADLEFRKLGQSGKLDDVTGISFAKSVEEATFAAQSAQVLAGSNRLELSGKVEIRSKLEKAVLRANRVVYDADQRVYIARGDVELDHPTFQLREGATLWVSSNFEEFGTTERTFKKKT